MRNNNKVVSNTKIVHVKYRFKHNERCSKKTPAWKFHGSPVKLYVHLHFYPPITRKQRIAVRARVGVADNLSNPRSWGNPVKYHFQQHNKRTCRLATHCPFSAESQAGKLWIPIFTSLVWPDSELNFESTDPEVDALSTRPFDWYGLASSCLGNKLCKLSWFRTNWHFGRTSFSFSIRKSNSVLFKTDMYVKLKKK